MVRDLLPAPDSRDCRGDAAYGQFLELSAHPFLIALNGVSLAFIVVHAVTWFNMTPAAMAVCVRGERVPPPFWVAAPNYVLWAIVSGGRWRIVRDRQRVHCPVHRSDKPAQAMTITHIFFDIGGVLGSGGWDTAQRALAAKRFDLDPAGFAQRHEERSACSTTEHLPREIIERSEALPGVLAAGGSTVIPLHGADEPVFVHSAFRAV